MYILDYIIKYNLPVKEAVEKLFSRYYNLSSTFPTTGSTIACQRRHSIGTFLEKEASMSTNATPGRSQTGGCRNLLEADTVAAPVPVDDIDGAPCNEDKQTYCNRIRRRRHKSSFNKGKYRST